MIEPIPVTVSEHLPEWLATTTRYSVDATIYFVTDADIDPGMIGIHRFNPNNPAICFRHEWLTALDDHEYYHDVIWALDADSPEQAAQIVQEHLAKLIPAVNGITIDRVEVGDLGCSGVYDNAAQEWCRIG